MIASKRDSLCMSILRAKYKIKQDWLHKDPPKSASPVRKAIEGAKNINAKGACYLIGNEASINVWLDPWVCQSSAPKSKKKNQLQASDKKI